MIEQIDVLKMRAEKVRDQASELVAWFATRTTQPSAALEMNPDTVEQLDRDIDQAGKALLAGDIPTDLWKPFWMDHMFGGSRKYSSDREYWEAALQHSRASIAFLDTLAARQRGDKVFVAARKHADLGAAPNQDGHPKGFQEAIIALVCRLPRRWSIAALLGIGVLLVAFAVWSSLPDATKGFIFGWFGAPKECKPEYVRSYTTDGDTRVSKHLTCPEGKKVTLGSARCNLTSNAYGGLKESYPSGDDSWVCIFDPQPSGVGMLIEMRCECR